MILSDDQILLQDTFQRFFANEMGIVKLRKNIDAGILDDPQFWSASCELGLCGLLAPAELGGGGVSDRPLLDLGLVATEVGRSLAPGPFITTNVVIDALARSQNSDRFAPIIADLMSGTQRTGWSPSPLVLKRQGNEERLFGRLDHVEHVGDVDAILVTAQREDELVQCFVPVGGAGLSITTQECIDLTRSIGSADFDGVVIDDAQITDTGSRAEEALQRQQLIFSALQCAETIGCMERVMEFTLEWMTSRYSFGRPIASYQALKHRMADMKLWLEASISVTQHALRALDTGSPRAAEFVSAAKAYVGAHSTELMQEAAQFHGGISVTWEHDLHLYLRRATLNRVQNGTPSDHRRRAADILEASING